MNTATTIANAPRSIEGLLAIINSSQSTSWTLAHQLGLIDLNDAGNTAFMSLDAEGQAKALAAALAAADKQAGGTPQAAIEATKAAETASTTTTNTSTQDNNDMTNNNTLPGGIGVPSVPNSGGGLPLPNASAAAPQAVGGTGALGLPSLGGSSLGGGGPVGGIGLGLGAGFGATSAPTGAVPQQEAQPAASADVELLKGIAKQLQEQGAALTALRAENAELRQAVDSLINDARTKNVLLKVGIAISTATANQVCTACNVPLDNVIVDVQKLWANDGAELGSFLNAYMSPPQGNG